ncbi:MAG: DnaJ C-terminal domain-containing protein [Vampirovibrionales bacterium]|nr:DnaJ C-terminal domain-containing protein [Vampirovibrionales bacterium]
MSQTLYETLELPPLADESAVKNAYRKLARKYHPDLNPDNKKQAEERFKAINDAYNILINPLKKKAYDATLHEPGRNTSQTAHNTAKQPSPPRQTPKDKATSSASSKEPKPSPSTSQADRVASASGAQNTPKPSNTADKQTDANPSLQDVFRAFWQPQPSAGKASLKSSPPRQASAKRGRDLHAEVTISSQEARTGCRKSVTVSVGPICQRCSGTGKLNGLVCPACHGEAYLLNPTAIEVKLPAGISHNGKVRIPGQGLKGLFGGAAGDLFLTINVLSKPKESTDIRIENPQENEPFTNKAKERFQNADGNKKPLTLQKVTHHGLDIHADLALSIPLGVLGGDVDVKTPGGLVTLSIPALISSGKTLKLKRQGLSQQGKTGDLLITLYLMSPQRLSPAEKKLYEALRDLSHP